jgi:hypothetical protein
MANGTTGTPVTGTRNSDYPRFVRYIIRFLEALPHLFHVLSFGRSFENTKDLFDDRRAKFE